MLRWAIVGTGFISNTVVDAIALSDASVVTRVAGRSPERTAAFQAEHGIAKAGSFDDAIADPDIDAIYIGTPNHQHHPYVVAAAAAGKAVLAEKSLTTTMDSARELLSAVEHHQTFFVEGLMYLAHPVYQRLAELLTDGRLGQLRSVSGRYGADIAQVVNPEGRGTIYNLGCYPASLMHFVVQTMCGQDTFASRTVTGVGNTNPTDGTVCDAALSVRFDNGVLATLQSSDNYGNASDFAVAGDQGVLRFETNPWLPAAGSNRMIWQPHDEPVEIIDVHDDHDAFFHQIKLVERHVARGDVEAARPSPRWSDSLEIMSLLTEWEALCLSGG